MSAPERLHATNTVRAAYAAVFGNIGAFAGPALLWLALWIIYYLATPTLAAIVVQALPAIELEDAELSLETFGAVAVQGIALIWICIAWHRFVILAAPLQSLFATEIGIVLRYMRRAALLMLPPIVLVGCTLWAGFTLIDFSPESFSTNALVHLIEAATVAALARVQLAFPATAIGESDPGFRRSWTLTRDSTLPLVAGILACDLPFTLMNIAVTEASITTETQTIEDYIASSAYIVIEFMRAAVVAAFLSHAYLHFTRADAANRPPASYFS